MNTCAYVCVYVNHIPKSLHELCIVMGEGPQPHPLQRLGADRKGPQTQVTSNPNEERKRETRQPITRNPHSSPADSKGRPQVEPPQPWSEGAREPGATGQAPPSTGPHVPKDHASTRQNPPRTTPPPSMNFLI